VSADDVVAHPAIAAELLAMGDADQAVREAPIDTKAMRDMDHRHLDRMRAIVDAIGWPTRSKVGERAEHLAWLLVQHADDVAFQPSRRAAALR
jgi:hypothetical protein